MTWKPMGKTLLTSVQPVKPSSACPRPLGAAGVCRARGERAQACKRDHGPSRSAACGGRGGMRGGRGRIPPGPARRTTACEHEAARASPSSLLRRPAPSHSRAARLCRSRALTQRWHVLSVRGHWRLLTWRRQVTCWASCRPSQPGCVDFRAAAGPTGRAVAAGLGGRVPAQPHQSAFPKRKRHKAQDGQCQLPCPREPTWSGNPQSEQEERCG